ncbi:unnamed protein product [Brachionus calyciflorus]|uniref:Acyltransferase 3 domain-containing protein n=1 Tax=Brachionus calyciflorus TaxID=104777 RepID=A0A813X7S5_9BILA|nr:unnamed protein product [Brachionus calyciflorus]
MKYEFYFQKFKSYGQRLITNTYFLNCLKISKNIIEFYLDDSQKSTSSRFDFLDGYRGLCAITVALHHMMSFFPDIKCENDVFITAGFFIGVFGFFVLSSFLLTYKMLKDFSKAATYSDFILIILKYSIRRLFRIYFSYVVYVTLISFGPKFAKGVYTYPPWSSLILLKPTLGPNHLWTIPIEIKFYFLIPFISLFFHFSKKYWSISMLVSIAVLYKLYQGLLLYTPADVNVQISNKLYPRFPIFYAGSIVALLYFKYESLNNEYISYLNKSKLAKMIIALFSFYYAAYAALRISPYLRAGMDLYGDSIHPGVKFANLLFLMLIGAPNCFTKIFGSNYALEMYGKYSFGVYLWHPSCIYIVVNLGIKTRGLGVWYYLPLLITFGVLFYYLIENPLMKLGNVLISKIDNYHKNKNSHILISN